MLWQYNHLQTSKYGLGLMHPNLVLIRTLLSLLLSCQLRVQLGHGLHLLLQLLIWSFTLWLIWLSSSFCLTIVNVTIGKSDSWDKFSKTSPWVALPKLTNLPPTIGLRESNVWQTKSRGNWWTLGKKILETSTLACPREWGALPTLYCTRFSFILYEAQ